MINVSITALVYVVQKRLLNKKWVMRNLISAKYVIDSCHRLVICKLSLQINQWTSNNKTMREK